MVRYCTIVETRGGPHGYSVEYPKILKKKFIYIVDYMTMYKKVEKTPQNKLFNLNIANWALWPTTPIRPKTPRPTHNSFISLSVSAVVQPRPPPLNFVPDLLAEPSTAAPVMRHRPPNSQASRQSTPTPAARAASRRPARRISLGRASRRHDGRPNRASRERSRGSGPPRRRRRRSVGHRCSATAASALPSPDFLFLFDWKF
jgi:hypothetical protein